MNTAIQKQIASNKHKTFVILGLFTVLITALVYILTKSSGLGWDYAFMVMILSGLTSFGSYYWSDKTVLSMSKAKPADKKKEAVFYQLVKNLCQKNKMPLPKLYIIEDSALNAFATGRDPQHGALCVTRGLLDTLEIKELEGVIGHELSHIANFDIGLMAVVSVMAAAVIFLSDVFFRNALWGKNKNREEQGNSILAVVGILFAILTPIVATLIQLSISRKREYLADASGALLTQNPADLAGALVKISSDRRLLKSASNATAHLCIADPFKNKNALSRFANLFETHPPIEERIAILRSL